MDGACGRVNRGLAAHGNTIFYGSPDGYLVAINANDGTVIWQVLVAGSSEGYSMTGAPLVIKRSVVVGIAGGEYGIRGFLAAYDISTGGMQWKFETIPGPGEAGDVVDALLCSAIIPGVNGCSFDVASGTQTSVREVVRLIGKISGIQVEPSFGSVPDRPLEQQRPADLTFAKTRLAGEPKTSLEDGLASTIRWYRDIICQALQDR